jgi:hypothetical protein
MAMCNRKLKNEGILAEFDVLNNDGLNWFTKLAGCILEREYQCDEDYAPNISDVKMKVQDNTIVIEAPISQRGWVDPRKLKNLLDDWDLPSTLKYLEIHWYAENGLRTAWGRIFIERISDGFIMSWDYGECWDMSYDCDGDKGIAVLQYPTEDYRIETPSKYRLYESLQYRAAEMLFTPNGLYGLMKVG